MSTMQALQWDGKDLAVRQIDIPDRKQGEARIKVLRAGICNTDLEILRGYHAFQGTLGHEFVGIVEACDNLGLVGCKVVSDINCACHACNICTSGNPHHCQNRVTVGIRGKDGVFAEYINLPERNLVPIRNDLPLELAVFAEPVAAALEILEQVDCRNAGECAVVGDGKLGLLVCMCLADAGVEVSLIGHHPERHALLDEFRVSFHSMPPVKLFPVVVEASGHKSGFTTALQLTRPQGTLVLKSTIADDVNFDTTPIVVNELTLVGSRCGPMDKAVRLLESGRIAPQRLVDRITGLPDAVDAVRHAGTKGVLKVILQM